MYISHIDVSISTERRACVWNVHCVPNIIIEEHHCTGTPGTGKYVFVGSRNIGKMCFVRCGRFPYVWVEHMEI